MLLLFFKIFDYLSSSLASVDVVVAIFCISCVSRYGIEDDETSQIISFLNNECNVLNQFGCFVYNRHLVWGGEGRKARKQFHVGDKIICTKNSDIPIYVDEKEKGGGKEKEGGPEKGEKEGGQDRPKDDLKVTISTDGRYEEPPNLNLKTKNERLMNGNLYKIRAVCRASVMAGKEEKEGEVEGEQGEGAMVSQEYHVLDDLAGDIVRARLDLLIKKTKITHAWALSIHKFQVYLYLCSSLYSQVPGMYVS